MNNPSPPVTAISKKLEDRGRYLKHIEAGLREIAKASEIYSVATMNERFFWSTNIDERRVQMKVKDMAKRFDLSAWLELMEDSGLSMVMSSGDKERFQKQVYEDTPELTRERAQATFVNLFEDRENIWRRGIVELFQKLSGNYRSHDSFKVGKRLILDSAWSVNNFNHWSSRGDEINDLHRVLSLLNGERPQEDFLKTVADTFRAGDNYEDERMQLKCFVNGNVHVRIKNQSDIDNINKIIAAWYGRQLGGTK